MASTAVPATTEALHGPSTPINHTRFGHDDRRRKRGAGGFLSCNEQHAATGPFAKRGLGTFSQSFERDLARDESIGDQPDFVVICVAIRSVTNSSNLAEIILGEPGDVSPRTLLKPSPGADTALTQTIRGGSSG